MVKVVRLIWRLDYSVSFAYLDRRGAALNALMNTVPDFWQAIGDGALPHSFAGNRTRDGVVRTISLETQALNGTIKWSAGIPLADVLSDANFRSLDKIVHELAKVCELKVLKRGGLRLICVWPGQAPGAAEQIRDRYRSHAEEVLGPITDVATTVEGEGEDRISYRAQFGPYDSKNVSGALERNLQPEEIEALKDNTMFLDIDLYERNFSFAEHSLFRWSETKVAKAAAFVAKFATKAAQDKGGDNGGAGAKH